MSLIDAERVEENDSGVGRDFVKIHSLKRDDEIFRSGFNPFSILRSPVRRGVGRERGLGPDCDPLYRRRWRVMLGHRDWDPCNLSRRSRAGSTERVEWPRSIGCGYCLY